MQAALILGTSLDVTAFPIFCMLRPAASASESQLVDSLRHHKPSPSPGPTQSDSSILRSYSAGGRRVRFGHEPLKVLDTIGSHISCLINIALRAAAARRHIHSAQCTLLLLLLLARRKSQIKVQHHVARQRRLQGIPWYAFCTLPAEFFCCPQRNISTPADDQCLRNSSGAAF